MAQIKKIWQFFLLGLSGWSFWALYFSYYVGTQLLTYIGGSICNLGIVSGSICKYPITPKGEWAGLTPFNSSSIYIVFFILLALVIIIKLLVYKKKIITNDYFDTAFKVFCITQITEGEASSITLNIFYFFIFFSFFQLCLYVFEKIKDKPHVKIVKNKKKIWLVSILFITLGVVELFEYTIFQEIFYEIDKRSYVDCCNNETVIGNYKFPFKNKNLPMCIFERNREKSAICKIEKPIRKSIDSRILYKPPFLPR